MGRRKSAVISRRPATAPRSLSGPVYSPPRVLTALQSLFDHGRLGGTGYVSILPVDQGIEHSAGASFAPNPLYFDPENIVKLGLEGGCNAVASTLGVLGAVARKYAHRIPFILKFNHNEFISYPNQFDQIRFASIKQAFDMGAMGVGATIYFGSDESKRQLVEVSEMFQQAHELGRADRFREAVAIGRYGSPEVSVRFPMAAASSSSGSCCSARTHIDLPGVRPGVGGAVRARSSTYAS